MLCDSTDCTRFARWKQRHSPRGECSRVCDDCLSEGAFDTSPIKTRAQRALTFAADLTSVVSAVRARDIGRVLIFAGQLRR